MCPRSHQPMLQLLLWLSHPILLSQPTGHQCWRYIRTHSTHTVFIILFFYSPSSFSFSRFYLSISPLTLCFSFSLSSSFISLSFLDSYGWLKKQIGRKIKINIKINYCIKVLIMILNVMFFWELSSWRVNKSYSIPLIIYTTLLFINICSFSHCPETSLFLPFFPTLCYPILS